MSNSSLRNAYLLISIHHFTPSLDTELSEYFYKHFPDICFPVRDNKNIRTILEFHDIPYPKNKEFNQEDFSVFLYNSTKSSLRKVDQSIKFNFATEGCTSKIFDDPLVRI